MSHLTVYIDQNSKPGIIAKVAAKMRFCSAPEAWQKCNNGSTAGEFAGKMQIDLSPGI